VRAVDDPTSELPPFPTDRHEQLLAERPRAWGRWLAYLAAAAGALQAGLRLLPPGNGHFGHVGGLLMFLYALFLGPAVALIVFAFVRDHHRPE
jgi:hypothetical protein